MDEIMAPCFCGGTEIKVSKQYINQGMDGSCVDWDLYCPKCHGHWGYPADGFYGRKYYTREEVIDKWNEVHGRSKR